MRQTSKIVILYILKYCGAFNLARAFTGKGLRILCYHGISVDDEHRFRERLFMREETFERRMHILRNNAYPVIPLRQITQLLPEGRLPRCAVVITFDDGWSGTCEKAFPILQKLGFASTLYLTTYYSEHRVQVFNVAVPYIFWKTKKINIILPGLSSECTRFCLSDPDQKQRAIEHMLAQEETLEGPAARQEFLRQLGHNLDVDVQRMEQQEILKLGAPSSISRLSQIGVDIQLHTHRHIFTSDDDEVLRKEIDENRRALSYLDANPLVHFCYPSGKFHTSKWPLLSEMGIETATTCQVGFNYADTPLLGLKRILDSESLTNIEFEAELSGIVEIWRRIRRVVLGWAGRRDH